MNKDVKQYIRAIQRQGFTVRISGSGHYLCTAPDGKRRVSVPSTPRGGRAVAGIRSALRRIGAVL